MLPVAVPPPTMVWKMLVGVVVFWTIVSGVWLGRIIYDAAHGNHNHVNDIGNINGNGNIIDNNGDYYYNGDINVNFDKIMNPGTLVLSATTMTTTTTTRPTTAAPIETTTKIVTRNTTLKYQFTLSPSKTPFFTQIEGLLNMVYYWFDQPFVQDILFAAADHRVADENYNITSRQDLAQRIKAVFENITVISAPMCLCSICGCDQPEMIHILSETRWKKGERDCLETGYAQTDPLPNDWHGYKPLQIVIGDAVVHHALHSPQGALFFAISLAHEVVHTLYGKNETRVNAFPNYKSWKYDRPLDHGQIFEERLFDRTFRYSFEANQLFARETKHAAYHPASDEWVSELVEKSLSRQPLSKEDFRFVPSYFRNFKYIEQCPPLLLCAFGRVINDYLDVKVSNCTYHDYLNNKDITNFFFQS